MKMSNSPTFFEQRLHSSGALRPGDVRTQYQRDRARIVHSAAFRRLQGKTQVMGVGEGDFHRTRLTHSIECAQIGNGILEVLQTGKAPDALRPWLPDRDLIEAACFAHDLGHPPFGHGGEKALHKAMLGHGGFEGNGQTLRIISRLEKYRQIGWGIDPTRRLVLAILKYPIPYSVFDEANHQEKPPKCYFDEETSIVEWACEGFSLDERRLFQHRDAKGKAKHRTFDCAAMELADDIAYGVHDIEDIVARNLVDREELSGSISNAFDKIGGSIQNGSARLSAKDVIDGLYADSFSRKQTMSILVNLFITNAEAMPEDGFSHPLLAYRVGLPPDYKMLLVGLKDLALKLVVKKAQVQQLEHRGQRIVSSLYTEMRRSPEELIPQLSLQMMDQKGTVERRVCDYIAGMTDSYAEKVYRRLFVPGFGSASDEL